MSKRTQIVLAVALGALLLAAILWGPTTVVSAVIDLVGRGRRLSDTSGLEDPSDPKTLDADPDKLTNDAAEIMGRAVTKDAYSAARMIRSEEGSQPRDVKALLVHVLINDAAEHGWSLYYATTVSSVASRSGYYGNQTSRRYSTASDPYEEDLLVAEQVIAERAAGGEDPTGGAVKFFNRGPLSASDWPDAWDAEGLVSENVDPAPDRLVFFTRGGAA